MRCFLMKNLFKPRITKFLKRTMCLVLAAFVLIPAISYSMPNGFASAKAAGSYETVGVGKKLVDCFPGQSMALAKYVYNTILGKSDWDNNGITYSLTDLDVDTIGNITSISIYLENLKADDLDGIQNFYKLEALSIPNNNLISLPDLSTTKITTLNCSCNQLTKIPRLPDCLESLDISCNNILDDINNNLPSSLLYLQAHDNQLTSIKGLPIHLRFLDVSKNKLTQISDKLPNDIKIFDCSDNNLIAISDLPNELTYFDCSNNRLSNIPNLPINLTYLDASKNQLIEIPELPNQLTYLDIHENLLRSLPETLPSSISYLYCNNNQLNKLPDLLPSSLNYLDLAYNQLTELPELPESLTLLSCPYNKLASIPEHLPSRLVCFDVHNNMLTKLPDNLPNSIIVIYCSDNQLSYLPNPLPKKLRYLYIHNNPNLDFIPKPPKVKP